MTQIPAFLFDLDGTLIDSEPLWLAAIAYALQIKGAKVNAKQIQSLGMGRAWDEIFADIGKRWPNCYENRQAMEKVTETHFLQAADANDICIPGSRSLLHRLAKEEYPITIVSGSTRKQVADAINRLQAKKIIKDYVAGEDIAKGKPDPEGFLRGAKLLQTKPENCIAFEDKEVGVLAAKAAGMRCVALRRQNNQKENLSAADLIMENLQDFSIQLLH